MPSPSTSAPSEAGPLLQTLSLKGRGALFLQVMFGIAILVALRFIVLVNAADPFGYVLLVIGLFSVWAVHSVTRLQLQAVALHEAGLVTHRKTGAAFTPFTAVQEVRKDLGMDGVTTYTVLLSEGGVLRLEPPRKTEAPAVLTFVEGLTTRAGLSWQGNQARR